MKGLFHLFEGKGGGFPGIGPLFDLSWLALELPWYLVLVSLSLR